MTVFASVDALRSAAGTDLGTSDWVTVTQERIDAFAECTEDRQWIHTDPVRAANGPFGGPIAHGYLTLSLLSRFLEDLVRVENVAAAVNYGLDRVRFPAPVPAGARVRGHGRIASVDEIPGGVQLGLEITVECEGVGKPVCVALSLARFLAEVRV
ncbi:MaoC family dehydratase [Prescottella soli]|uniref:MaoC family dehydratase n=1 Tax=Prescottella soli TaxID=1543852 RepID=A0ABW9FNL4_9NOCA